MLPIGRPTRRRGSPSVPICRAIAPPRAMRTLEAGWLPGCLSTQRRFLEDFAVGQVFRSGRLSVDADQIKAFAAAFDPQPFHLDEEAARSSMFEGLAASGWHTAALTMRLLVESEVKPAGGLIGAGFTDFRWPR